MSLPIGNTVHHIAVIGTNYEDSRHFYVDILGFEVVREVWREERKDHLTMLQNGDVTLELFTKHDAPARPTQPEALGRRHLSFHVENVEEAAAWLNALGVETEPIRTDPVNGGKMTFFRDPDGLPLELHE